MGNTATIPRSRNKRLQFVIFIPAKAAPYYLNVEMKKIIVTGGAGFIGSHTVVELINEGYTPVIVDDFSNTDERILKGLEKILGSLPTLYKIDCCDKSAMHEIFAHEKPDAIIHFAAYKAVGESVELPLKYYRNNISSLLTVLELMVEFDVRRLVFSSSCTIYGQPDTLPVDENTPEQPTSSPYGYSKQVGERILRDFQLAYQKMNVALLRYFNPIGAHHTGFIGELPNGIPNNLVPYITQTAAGVREQLVVYGDDYNTADGSCIRDFIHVKDLASAHVRALDWLLKQDGICDAFNLGQGRGNTVLEVIKSFEKVNNLKLNYKIGPRRTGDVEQIYADASKAEKILNWKTQLSLDEALKDAWRWQQQLEKL